MENTQKKVIEPILFRLYIFHGHNNRKTSADILADTPLLSAESFMRSKFEVGEIVGEPVPVKNHASRHAHHDEDDFLKWSVITTVHKKRLYISCNTADYNRNLPD